MASWLNNPEAVEEESRESLGMIAKDEVLYVITTTINWIWLAGKMVALAMALFFVSQTGLGFWMAYQGAYGGTHGIRCWGRSC